MNNKLQNRIKRVLYRPIRKNRPHRDFVAKKLEDMESTLNSTVGGMFAKRRRKR
ncbi:MAG: hypothetical protein FWB74_01450 [Defluviitaleaceae bacterium]|nr:hypothetical protein [Defluviitaleaceae bacterium]